MGSTGGKLAGDGMVEGEGKPLFSLYPLETLAAAGSYGLRALQSFWQWWATATGCSSVRGTGGAAIGGCRLQGALSILPAAAFQKHYSSSVSSKCTSGSSNTLPVDCPGLGVIEASDSYKSLVCLPYRFAPSAPSS